jgi:hypothetical protein
VIGKGCIRYGYTFFAVIGHWQSRAVVPGDAEEVGWLTRAEIIEQNPPTARNLCPLIDLVVRI